MLNIRKATLSTALFLVAASVGAAQAAPNDGLASHQPSSGAAVSQDWQSGFSLSQATNGSQNGFGHDARVRHVHLIEDDHCIDRLKNVFNLLHKLSFEFCRGWGPVLGIQAVEFNRSTSRLHN